MPGFDGPIEGAVALAGQFAGALPSPESWILRFPGMRWAIGKVAGEAADTVAGRILEAELSQGAIKRSHAPPLSRRNRGGPADRPGGAGNRRLVHD
jgi:hypothetical protein